jgi:hypothetical protein
LGWKTLSVAFYSKTLEACYDKCTTEHLRHEKFYISFYVQEKVLFYERIFPEQLMLKLVNSKVCKT